MFGPDWEEGCKSCSLLLDHMDGLLCHLAARDTAFVAVSKAPIAQLEAFKKRMGWKSPWVSFGDSSFGHDFQVSFTARDMAEGKVEYNYQRFPAGPLPVEEFHGASVFARADGAVYHTYSAYARGVEHLLGVYNWLDLTPKGRDEDGLAHTMGWLRHHDRYDQFYHVDPSEPYAPPRGSICRQPDAV
jgi:predicted dithiol-disulfide oxidoreductase (DUF899 family)